LVQAAKRKRSGKIFFIIKHAFSEVYYYCFKGYIIQSTEKKIFSIKLSSYPLRLINDHFLQRSIYGRDFISFGNRRREGQQKGVMQN